MQVDVGDRGRFARQLRLVVVLDIARVLVEQVVDAELHAQVLSVSAAGLDVDERRVWTPYTVVFDERRGPEVAQPRAAEPEALAFIGEAKRGDTFHSAGNLVARRVVVRESRLGPGEVRVHDHAVEWPSVHP